jgi:hypothetical protein
VKVTFHCERAACTVAAHNELLSRLQQSKRRVVAAKADLAAAVGDAHDTVRELEECLLQVSEGLRRPRVSTTIQDVVQLSQRLGYVVSAPLRWQVMALCFQSFAYVLSVPRSLADTVFRWLQLSAVALTFLVRPAAGTPHTVLELRPV